MINIIYQLGRYFMCRTIRSF